jgi:hypothetical protein
LQVLSRRWAFPTLLLAAPSQTSRDCRHSRRQLLREPPSSSLVRSRIRHELKHSDFPKLTV